MNIKDLGYCSVCGAPATSIRWEIRDCTPPGAVWREVEHTGRMDRRCYKHPHPYEPITTEGQWPLSKEYEMVDAEAGNAA